MERFEEDLAAVASTPAEAPVSLRDDDSPERTPRRERKATRKMDESPKPVREESPPEEPKPEPSPVESRPAAPPAPATGVAYGRSGKRATRGLHSQAARAELEAAKPPEERRTAVAESSVSTPQRHGSLAKDSERDFRAPEVEIVRESGSTPAGAPSGRYRAAESGGSDEKGVKRREREETSVDPDERSEP